MSLSWLRQWLRRFFPALALPSAVRAPSAAHAPGRSRAAERLPQSGCAASSSYGVNNSLHIQYTNTGTTPWRCRSWSFPPTTRTCGCRATQDSGSRLQLLAANPTRMAPPAPWPPAPGAATWWTLLRPPAPPTRRSISPWPADSRPDDRLVHTLSLACGPATSPPRPGTRSSRTSPPTSAAPPIPTRPPSMPTRPTWASSASRPTMSPS